ncbi:MAG: Rid family hydrolase [Gemmatimonadota bacterium]|jgi:2-iminobutanoate/2-iminopropanoate deaminase|nr:Rid family hydrolase [Gemmatimonadota bacterium]
MSHPDAAPDRLWTPVELPNVPAPAGAYSPGVRTANISNLLFVSGQTPRDQATGEILQGDVEAQTRLTLANMERILIAGGATFANVVSMTVYLADENDWGTFDRVYRTIMSPPYPTRAVVGASLRGILVEISAIAVV